jgi:hypothetical protein
MHTSDEPWSSTPEGWAAAPCAHAGCPPAPSTHPGNKKASASHAGGLETSPGASGGLQYRRNIRRARRAATQHPPSRAAHPPVPPAAVYEIVVAGRAAPAMAVWNTCCTCVMLGAGRLAAGGRTMQLQREPPYNDSGCPTPHSVNLSQVNGCVVGGVIQEGGCQPCTPPLHRPTAAAGRAQA